MAKAAKATSPMRSKTPSAKLRTKPAILTALEGMPFDGSAVVGSARSLADSLAGRSKTTLRKVRVKRPDDLRPEQISSIRRRLNVSQSVFAGYLGVRPTSVMSWEYGRRAPSGPVLRLLQIADRHPEVLLEVA
jgi:putative transcriptional regulator